MADYLSIGKVSKLKNVSIKSLRYYDEIGILKPAYVNKQTNYRYYTENQLFVLDAINLCLQLGIPLKDLHQYAKDEHLDLQKLLYDGKILAEQKIGDIRTCLEHLENTLTHMKSASFSNQTYPSTIGDNNKVTIPEQILLVLPLDEFATPKYYGQYILKLFVTAQQHGFSASYPSGIIHEHYFASVSRYMCLRIQTIEGNPASFSNYQSWKASHPAVADLLRYYPACTCHCHLLTEHVEGDASVYLKEYLPTSGSFILLENDIMEESIKAKGYMTELLLLTTSH